MISLIKVGNAGLCRTEGADSRLVDGIALLNLATGCNPWKTATADDLLPKPTFPIPKDFSYRLPYLQRGRWHPRPATQS